MDSPYLSRLARGIEPYVPGEQPTSDGLIKLNTNENPYPPSPRGRAAAIRLVWLSFIISSVPAMTRAGTAIFCKLSHRIWGSLAISRKRSLFWIHTQHTCAI